MLLSGDVHLAEAFQAEGADESPLGAARPLLEVTSSGLTHSTSVLLPDSAYHFLFPSRRRVGRAYVRRNFGLIRVVVHDRATGALRVVVSVHAVESGAEVLRVEPVFAPDGSGSLPATERPVHLPLLPAPLTQLVLAVHSQLAPEAPRYLSIIATVLTALAGVAACVVLAIRAAVRRLKKVKKE